MYYDSTLKKNIRLRVTEIPANISTDEDADNFCRQKEGEHEAAKLRIQRRLEWKQRYHKFSELVEIFKEARKKESPNNWNNDVYYVEQYVLNFFVNQHNYININDWNIHFEDFRDWLDIVKTAKGGGPLAYSTKNQCIKALNAFLKVMRRKNKVEKAERCAQFPRHLENAKTSDDVMTDDEARNVFNELTQIDQRSAYLFLTLVNTGLRINEGLGLSLGDIFSGNVPNTKLHNQLLTHKINYVGYICLESQPKCGSRLRLPDSTVPRKPLKGKHKIEPANNRIVPIVDKSVFNRLVELWKIQHDKFNTKKYGKNKKDYLLFDGLNKAVFSNHLRRACSNLKIKLFTPHSCRHTFATNFTGMTFGDIFLCQIVLGHADIQTSRKYIHLWEQIHKEVISDSQIQEGLEFIE